MSRFLFRQTLPPSFPRDKRQLEAGLIHTIQALKITPEAFFITRTTFCGEGNEAP